MEKLDFLSILLQKNQRIFLQKQRIWESEYISYVFDFLLSSSFTTCPVSIVLILNRSSFGVDPSTSPWNPDIDFALETVPFKKLCPLLVLPLFILFITTSLLRLQHFVADSKFACPELRWFLMEMFQITTSFFFLCKSICIYFQEKAENCVFPCSSFLKQTTKIKLDFLQELGCIWKIEKWRVL